METPLFYYVHKFLLENNVITVCSVLRNVLIIRLPLEIQICRLKFMLNVAITVYHFNDSVIRSILNSK